MPQTPTEHSREVLRAVQEHPAYLYTWQADGVDRYVFGGSDAFPDFTALGITEAYNYTLEHPAAPKFPDAVMVHRLRASESRRPPGPSMTDLEKTHAAARARANIVDHPFPWEGRGG